MLDQKFINERRADLEKIKNRLEDELGRFTETKAEGRQAIFPEIGDKEDESAQEVEMYESSLGLEKNLEERLKNIINALKQIEDGKYGQCTNCDQEVPRDRLVAYPEAQLCLNCLKKEKK